MKREAVNCRHWQDPQKWSGHNCATNMAGQRHFYEQSAGINLGVILGVRT